MSASAACVSEVLFVLAFGCPSERQRKVTNCARVQLSFGLNQSGAVPLVMPRSAAQRTLSVNHLPAGMSQKPVRQ